MYMILCAHVIELLIILIRHHFLSEIMMRQQSSDRRVIVAAAVFGITNSRGQTSKQFFLKRVFSCL